MAVATYVGSFIKSNSTGNQDITIPVDLTGAAAGTWAIMFWTTSSRQGSGTWESSIVGSGIGYTTGSANSYAVGTYSEDGVAAGNTARRMAAKCITSPDPTGAGTLFEADFVSFPTAASMRVNWTTNGSWSSTINYLLITGLTGAKVVNWTTLATTGSKSVTGVGFSPDTVLHSTITQDTLPVSNSWATMTFGAMNKHGQQWSNSFISVDGANPTNSSRWQQTDACLAIVADGDLAYGQAHFSSMDADGFTTYFSIGPGSTRQVISLCLGGVSSKLGAFTTPTTAAPVSQTIASRHGFTPRGLLFTNHGSVTEGAPGSRAMWGLGATDLTNHRAAALMDKDGAGSSGSPTTTLAKSVWYNDKSLIVSKDDAGTTMVAASVSSATSEDYTLSHTTTDTTRSYEILYLLLGDDATQTFPLTINTANLSDHTASTATAYSNQKKTTILSTGRHVAVTTAGTASGQFYWWDDDSTVGTYYVGAGIAGWANGSIDAYVDSPGNVERLVAVWKQSGTGGGRTDGVIYAMCGAFSGDRTTITWAAAQAVYTGGGFADLNYPDTVVHAEGSGGIVHVVASYTTTGANLVNYHQAVIDNAGAIAAFSAAVQTSDGGVNLHPFPSIDYNPDTKDLYIAWSAGTSGSGKGIRFRKAAYSGGTWTWGSEVEVDNRVWIQADYLWCIVRWDGTKAILGGQVYESVGGFHNVLYEIDPTSLAVQILYYNPQGNNDLVHQNSGGLAIDPGTRDIYVIGRFTAEVRMRKYNRSTSAFEPYALFDTVNDVAWISVLYYNSRIHWIYTAGNNSPYAVKYDYLQLNNPEVGLTLPQNAASEDLNSGHTFKWSYYDEGGDPQTHWAFKRIRTTDTKVEYWNNSNTSWQNTEIYNSGTATQVTFAAGKWAQGTAYSWTVSVKNANGISGYAPAFSVTDSNTSSSGVTTEVGSFTKQNTVGFQDITISTDLTSAPAGSWAVVFWTTGPDNPASPSSGVWGVQPRTTIGFVANGGGSISQYAVSSASRDNVATSDSARRMAAKAIAIVHENTAGSDDADFAGFPTSTSMRVNWTSQYKTTTEPINYMVISGLTGAKVVNWQPPASTGNKSVTGLGFSPDLILSASQLSATMDSSATNAYGGLGAMNKHGQQWANTTVSKDNDNGGVNSATARWQQTDAMLLAMDYPSTMYLQAHYVSMDSDGFTVNFSTNALGTGCQIISLALHGVSSKLGAFTARTTTGSQTIDTRQGFTPKAALFSGLRRAPSGGPETSAIWHLGATDLANHRAAALTDLDASSPTFAKSVWHNDTTIAMGNGSTDYAAIVTAVATDTTTLNWTAAGGSAVEELYLLIGDAGDDSFPAQITKPGYTNSATATAYSNQKKLVTLSTGMKWVVWTDSDGAKFSYSSDAQAWTEYSGAQIAGFSNGSIAAYVDSGGTERLVAVWKQSGTGGGRTDGRVYVICGSFNSGRTTITWGAAAEPWGAGAFGTLANYPDIVAHAEGGATSGYCHVALSYSSPSEVRRYIQSIPITDNTLGSTAVGGASSSYGTSGNVFPSIDINPITKDLYTAWSGVTTGAGQGIRFSRDVYSNGTWTRGPEVEVDNTVYVNTADGQSGIVCRWTGSEVVIGVSYTPSATRKVYESTNFTSFSTILNSTGTNVYGIGMSVDLAARDIYLFGHYYNGSTYISIEYRRYVRSTTTWASAVTVDHTNTGSGSIPHHVNAFPVTGGIGWVYTRGNNAPYAVAYDQMIINMPPVVSLSSPAASHSADLTNNTQAFSWTITDTEGDTQAKYVLRRRKSGHTAYEYWDATGSQWTSTLTENTSVTMNVTVSAGNWPAGEWYWSVGVRDSSAASAVGYSSERLITNTGFAGTVNTYVGSFTKQSGTGNQDVTITPDLTAAPDGSWAIVFWSSGPNSASSGAWNDDAAPFVGFTTGASNSYSAGAFMADAVATSETARRMAAKCITIPDQAGAGAYQEADFVSFPTSTSMRVNWTTGSAFLVEVMYMIITGLTGAKVVNWTTPTTAIDKAVTGVGFNPDLVLHGSVFSAAPPNSDTDPPFAFGMMNKYGQQAANGFFSNDAQNPSNTSRYQQTDACIAAVSVSEALKMQAHFKSMDTDGFTVTFSTTEGTARNMMSLCIKGVSSKLGVFAKTQTAAPTNQVIDSRQGFMPKALLFSGAATDAPSSAPLTRAKWFLGASDLTNERSAALTDQDNVSPTQAKSVWYSGKSLLTIDAGTTYSEASVSAVTNSSFTAAWSTNDTSTAHELLYLALGDPEINSTPATIGTSTATTATAYSNQKKLVRLSAGRMVAVFGDTATNAKFKYSDDGITWVDYNADIAGWANGSIAAYVDASGTERVVAIWKQSGTGGGRTTGRIYLMVGTFSSAGTSLTWGTAILQGSNTNDIYPDVVAHSEGAGGVAHAVYSYDGTVLAQWQKNTISPTGVPTAGAGTQISTGTGITNSWNSIDYNPLTKDLYVAWEAGTTGAGKGIRFRGATYGGGTWTWASEVEVDNTLYVGSTNYSVICRWVPSIGVRIWVTGYTGTGYRERLYSIASPFTTPSILWTHDSATGGAGPLFLYGAGMAADLWTGDCYILGTQYIGGGRGMEDVLYYKWTHSTASMSSATTKTDSFVRDTGGSLSAFVSPNYYNGRIEWVYEHGNNSPYAVKYDYIATGAPTVTLTAPENGARVDLDASSQQFSWSFTDAESDTQSAYIFRRRRDGHIAYEYWNAGITSWTTTLTENTSATTNVTIPAGNFTAGKHYYWSVGVKDTSGAIGYSTERTITNSAAEVNTYVGSFNPSGITGNQDVVIPVDLSSAPAGSWSILFWGGTQPGASGAWQSYAAMGVGFAANGGGSVSEYSIAAVSADNRPTASVGSDAARRLEVAAFTLVDQDGAGNIGRANFVSFPDATHMRLNWSAAMSSGRYVHYMIITGLSGAKAVAWNDATSATAKQVTGIGFSPDLVLNATTMQTVLPQSAVGAEFGFGAFNKHGQQWANAFHSADASNPSNTQRGQQTDAAIYAITTTPAVDMEGHFKSMDADGFTVHFSDSGGGSRYIISLALKGVTSKLSAFVGAGASQTVESKHGFMPKGLLVSGFGNGPLSAPRDHTMWNLGATDLTNSRTIHVFDLDLNGATGNTIAKSVWRNDALTVHPNATATPTDYTRMSLTSAGTDSFEVAHTGAAGFEEQLYLLLGDADDNTFPATIGTSTATTATAYSNQKKLLRLSTGRMVAVFGDTATNAKFKYSDDGATWVDYQADIAGWANGSIYATADDKLHAVWRQSGTGGGRTDDRIYYAIGSLNTAKTALTWTVGSPLYAGGSMDYPDLVACQHNSEWRVFVAASFTSGGVGGLEIQKFTITSGLSISGTRGQFGSNINNSNHQFPSVDINPSTNDAYVAWSRGATGSGNGIRFMKATYANGVWTNGTEREIDSSVYAADAVYWLNCRFDGARVIIGGILWTGAERIVVYERDANDTTTITHTIDTSVAAADRVYAGSLAYDQDQNFYLFGTKTPYPNITQYYKWVRATGTLTGPFELDQAVMQNTYIITRFEPSLNRIEWVYTVGNNSPYAVKYNYIQTTGEEDDNLQQKWGIVPI